jgi:uncharacterized protein (DUF952 family)
MNWGTYLTRGPFIPIYHMCDKSLYDQKTIDGNDYFPPTYSVDGFIHATENPTELLSVGDHFYKNVPGEWICLELNPYYLLGTVVYEAAAGVGNIEAMEHNSSKLPHIYGGIPVRSVVRKLKIVRGSDGSFLSIEKLA